MFQTAFARAADSIRAAHTEAASIPLAISRRNQVDPDGDLWLSVPEATGQPPRFR